MPGCDQRIGKVHIAFVGAADHVRTGGKLQLRALIRAGQNFEDEPFIGFHVTNETSDSAA